MSIQVQTTHNVAIEYKTSNPWRRTVAYFIDLFILFLWFIIWFTLILSSVNWSNWANWNNLEMLFMLIVFIPIALYDLMFEYFNNGQSPGKMILKMRVINTEGTHPTFPTYVIRWVFRPIDFTMTMGTLAFILIGLTKNSQRLGDYVAGTTVIDLEVEKSDMNISLSDLSFNDRYRVTYSNILSLLSDKDIRIIIKVLQDHDHSNREKLALKLEQVTGYNYDRNAIQGVDIFLNTIVNDYNFLALKTI